jgi:hypothetical protein
MLILTAAGELLGCSCAWSLQLVGSKQWFASSMAGRARDRRHSLDGCGRARFGLDDVELGFELDVHMIAARTAQLLLGELGGRTLVGPLRLTRCNSTSHGRVTHEPTLSNRRMNGNEGGITRPAPLSDEPARTSKTPDFL